MEDQTAVTTSSSKKHKIPLYSNCSNHSDSSNEEAINEQNTS